MRKRISPTTVFLLSICALLFLVTATLGYSLTSQSSKAIRSQIESRMLDVANTAAAMLDGDTLETLEAGDSATAEYQAAYNILTVFKENIELEYIYCIRDMKDGTFVFLIDSDAVEPGAFGEHIPYTDALYQASLGTPSVDKVPYQDKWGRFYSAYSPVFDSRHRVAGIVAVDFSADWYERQIFSQVRTTLLISLLALVFAGVVITLFGARFRNQFRHLFNEVNQVSDRIETLVNAVSPGTTLHLDAEREAPAKDVIEELGNRFTALECGLSQGIERVRAQAYLDALTGLENRTAYEECIARLEERIRSGTAQFALAVFDVNGLKEINDNYGHEEGDRAIIAVSDAIRTVFLEARKFRIGGDEYVVILEGDTSTLTPELKRVDRLLAEHSSVEVSKGQAVFIPGKDQAYQSVFQRADDAMYDDKRTYYRTHPDRRRHGSA